jgi:hypothetical protein
VIAAAAVGGIGGLYSAITTAVNSTAASETTRQIQALRDEALQYRDQIKKSLDEVNSKELTVRKLTLVDANGLPRARLLLLEDVAGNVTFELLDRSGTTRVASVARGNPGAKDSYILVRNGEDQSQLPPKAGP